MELKVGYQQTEVGIIPDDWSVESLGRLGHIVRGGSPRPAGDPRYFDGDFIPWLTVAALTNIPEHQLEVSETATCLTKEGSDHSRTLPSETLIIANSGATLGVAKLLKVTCCANDGIAAIINQRLGEKRFVCFYINTQTKKLREVVATGNGQPNLNTGLIRRIPLPFPPPTEQRAIAEVLSDVDGLLAGLDQLIAKKRDLKQAAMQQLLTGQTRLPGFTEEWEVRKVHEFGEVVTGGTPSTEIAEYWGGTYPWITPTDISTRRDIFTSGRCLTKKGLEAVRCLLPNAVLVTCIASIGKNAVLRTLGACNQQINAVVANKSYHAVFLYYMFEASVQYLLANSGITATRIISKRAFSELIFRLPRLEEQTAIADVLSDMDAELAALEQRREKTHALKVAMMQELLTGRTRLV